MRNYIEYTKSIATLRKSNNKFVKELISNAKCNIRSINSKEFESFYEGIGEGNYILIYMLYKDYVNNKKNSCTMKFNVNISFSRGIKIVEHIPCNKSSYGFTFEFPIIDNDDDLLDLLFTA